MSKDSNIPNNYFNNLPDKIWAKIDQMDDRVKEHAPHFHALSQSNPYKVPDAYFETFESRLQLLGWGRILSLKVIRPYFVAASILLVAVLSWIMMPENSTDDPGADDLLYADVYDYYSDEIEYIDQNLLVGFEADDFEEASLVTEELTEEEIYLYEEAILQEMTDQELLGIL
ncbi:MAG: hypothetical protein HKN09_06370 [Saprospiraceae bacterium]|nr:hypothetical protein [Saprospiraceae bacterium]